MSPLSFSSSSGSKADFGSSLTFSNGSEEVYGMRLLPNATFVSNLHPGRGFRRVGRRLLASEETERGEWLPRPPFGEGDRDRDANSRGY